MNLTRFFNLFGFTQELVKYVCEHDRSTGISVEERNLLSVGYKNVVGTRRASWRQIPHEHPDEDSGLQEYRGHLEDELESTCLEIIHLLEEYLINDSLIMEEDASGKKVRRSRGDDDEEARVFYLKMAGDYYRYLSEFRPRSRGFHEKAKNFYHQALDVACGYADGWKALPPTHPIRLGLALNFSVCYYEILGERENACNLALQAFDEAIICLDSLDEPSFKDTTLIMGLLRDNLLLWKSEPEDVNEYYDE